MQPSNLPPDGSHPTSPGRRRFLKLSALTAAAAAGSSLRAAGAPDLRQLLEGGSRSNTRPGRIVIYHDPTMQPLEPSPHIDKDRVAEVVQHGVRILTNVSDTGAAFEALFPGLTSESRIAIKINLIGPTDTRWEMVRGIVSGLSLMLGGTYDVSRVTIYDNYNPLSHGYSTGEFTFNGHAPTLTGSADCYSGYYVYGSHQLSRYLLNYDYVINCPAVKSHSDSNNQLTFALKNHYGSCCPPSLCGNITGMLTVNADANVKGKTALVLMDGLRGTYTGGPGEPPQVWSTFTEGTPNTLFFSTDPVTNEYWGRDLINAERVAHGWSPKPCPWIETASAAPYELGVSDPEQMSVIRYDPADVPEDPAQHVGLAFLAPNVPNPFRDSTRLRFRLPQADRARLTILDATGRLVRDLGEREWAAGYAELAWDGRDAQGALLPAGVYLARLEVGARQYARRLLRVR